MRVRIILVHRTLVCIPFLCDPVGRRTPDFLNDLVERLPLNSDRKMWYIEGSCVFHFFVTLVDAERLIFFMTLLNAYR